MPVPRIEQTMKLRTIIAVAATVALVGGVFAWREYAREKPDTRTLEAEETISAKDLFSAFVADEQAATARFVGTTEQVVQVNGTIRAIEHPDPALTNVLLETEDPLGAVVCEFPKAAVPSFWRAGDAVSIKGICTGSLIDVVLVRCVPADLKN